MRLGAVLTSGPACKLKTWSEAFSAERRRGSFELRLGAALNFGLGLQT